MVSHHDCRHQDSCLMEDFLLEAPTAMELQQLNLCRLFLRVTTLSDICNANGRAVTKQCWEGTQPTDAIQLWSRQQKPPSKADAISPTIPQLKRNETIYNSLPLLDHGCLTTFNDIDDPTTSTRSCSLSTTGHQMALECFLRVELQERN